MAQASLVQRAKTSFPAQLVQAYGKSKGAQYAAGLAFQSFLTMFPLMLGLLTILGLVISDAHTRMQVEQTIISIFPSSAHQQMHEALTGVSRHAGILGVISVLGLIWSGTGLFAAMEFALTQTFGSRQRDMLRQRAMGLLMMIAFVLAVIITVAANGAAAFLPFMPVTGFLVGALVMIALLTLIYRFVPNRSFELGQIIWGAVFAGVLIAVLTQAFPIYAGFTHGFNTYGQTFGLFFLLATWLYFLSQILLLGAVFNRLRLGPPEEAGLAAAPDQQSQDAPRPEEAIEQVRQEAESGKGRQGGPPQKRREPDRRPGPERRRGEPAPVGSDGRRRAVDLVGSLALRAFLLGQTVRNTAQRRP